MHSFSRPSALGIALCLVLAGIAIPASAQVAVDAVADNGVDVSVARPAYAAGAGPVVALDEGHNNYHTLEGRYAPFGAVLANDGYRVVPLRGRFDAGALAKVDVLVVANPLAAANVERWALPTPSAFDDAEIEAVKTWVGQGGSLFLIADHMPFPGGAGALAKAFGFEFDNAYAVKGDGRVPEIFSWEAGTLADTALTRGLGRGFAVSEVQAFMGSSFRAPAGATPLATLDEGWALLYPSEVGKFDAATPRRPATRADLRAAALEHGRGRVVVVSEAAMFTNQMVNGAPYGFGQPSARQNKQFLVNIAEWLSRAPPSR